MKYFRCFSERCRGLDVVVWPYIHSFLFFCIFSSPRPASEAVQPEEEGEEDATLPSTEDVICKTEQITKNIQELLRAAQETKHER